MVKSFIWSGSVVLAVGIVVGLFFVVPHIGQAVTPALNGGARGEFSPLAVLVSAVGLAVGSTLVGVGVGRWKHPRSHHGPEV